MRTPHIIGDAGVTDEVKRLRDEFRYPDEIGGGGGGVLGGGGGGAPTVVVAAPDASDLSKSKADFTCSGAADQDVINQAMDILPSGIGGRLILTEGTYSLSDTINIPAASMVHIEGSGWQASQLQMATSGINMITLNDANTNLVLRDVQFDGQSNPGIGLLVSAGASLYVTHCQFFDIDTTAIDSSAQFVNQVIDCLIQNAATGIIYRNGTGRGHITGNDFENNTTDISIVNTAGTVVVANRSTGATTFLSRSAGTVYAWANDEGAAAYAGTIIRAHNSSKANDHATGAIDVDQASAAGAVPVITLDQADIDEDYFKFIGTSDTNVDRALVDAANFTTPGAIVGWLKVNIQDDQGTAPIVDGDYYIPFYAAPSA